jgi:hypothetical protein
MRRNGWAMPAWDADSDVGHPGMHPISQIGQNIMGDPANTCGRRLTRFNRSFGRDVRVTGTWIAGAEVHPS